MFKRVFGNDSYYINENGVIKDRDLQECTLDKSDVSEGHVRLSINGHKRVCCLKWLWLMSLYEVKLPEHLKKCFEYITFAEVNNGRRLLNRKYIMEFTRPINLDNEFRIIPGYTDYAISREGVVKDWRTGKIIKPEGSNKNHSKRYPRCRVYDPYRGEFRSIVIHRLVALAWVLDRPLGAFFVNHKDGDKTNYHYKNLEWVTIKQNNIHAVINRLRGDNLPTRIRDFETGEVTEYHSLSEACKSIGIRQRQVDAFKTIRPGKLVNNRYEVRIGDDNTPWFYTEKDKAPKQGRYTITAKLSKDDVRTYYDRRDFQKDLKIWNVPNIDQAIAKGKELYPTAKFSYVDHYETRPIQMLNLKTGEITEHPTIMDIARLIGEHKSNIRRTLVEGEHRSYKGYAFRYKTDKPWTKEISDAPPKSVCIQARHESTGQVLEFESLRKLAEHFDKDRSVFNMRLRTGKDWEGWTFSKM